MSSLKIPLQKANHNVAPCLAEQKDILKTWLSLVKFVSVKYFQKELPDIGKAIHTRVIEPPAEHSTGHPHFIPENYRIWIRRTFYSYLGLKPNLS